MSPPIRPQRDCMVLIPYYESPDGLKVAVESIDDTTGRIAVVVVDDGSITYPAVDAVGAIHTGLPIEVLVLPRNSGIEHALNHGLRERARYFAYVARLDCGDRVVPGRFEAQLRRLDDESDLHLIGGATQFFGDGGRYIHRPPQSWKEVRRAMKVNSAFIHPAVTFRSDLVDLLGCYPTNRPAAEDYAYFWSIAERFRSENLAAVVVEAEISRGGISSSRRRRQIRSRMRIMLDHFDWTPLAVWGLARSLILLATPRELTAWIRSVGQRATRADS